MGASRGREVEVERREEGGVETRKMGGDEKSILMGIWGEMAGGASLYCSWHSGESSHTWYEITVTTNMKQVSMQVQMWNIYQIRKYFKHKAL